VRLWNSGTCPYAQRVWIALLEKHVPFEHKLVDLQDKPADFTAVYNSVSPDPTARAKVRTYFFD
jgi:glutathione S-transferase